jgi:taurine--2-oxoglutarate transaminase
MKSPKVNYIEAFDRKHVFGTWAFQSKVSPKQVVDAEGVYFIDADGNKYLDFSSQLMCVNIGHKDRRVIQAITEQAEKLTYVVPKFTTQPRAELAKKLAEITPGSLIKTFFSTSGTEAVEAAIKIARYYTGKQKIISRYRSYHGSTYGSISLTGDPRRLPAEPSIPGAIKAPDPYCYRCSFGKEYPGCNLECVEYIDEMLTLEGDTIAGVVVEPVVGSNGILVPPDEYLPRLQKICDDHNALLIADEVMTGFGRTGEWFGVDLWDVEPDIMTLAKGLTSAYIPLGATVVSEGIADFFEDNLFCHGHTYSGHALACAAGIAALKVYEEDNLIERAKEQSKYLLKRLKELQKAHKSVGDVRGVGLFCGVELVRDQETKEPFTKPKDKLEGNITVPDEVAAKAKEQGVYVVNMYNTLIIAPPLIITKEEIDKGIEALDEALKLSDSKME